MAMAMFFTLLIATDPVDCDDNPWGVETNVTSDGTCYVSYEDYNDLAVALDTIEQSDLSVEIPVFRVLRDEAGRRYVRIEDRDEDGEPDRVHIRLGDPDIYVIHKSVPLIIDDLFTVEEVTPEPCPSCFRPWDLSFSVFGGLGITTVPHLAAGGSGSFRFAFGNSNAFVRNSGVGFNGSFAVSTLNLPVTWWDARMYGELWLRFPIK